MITITSNKHELWERYVDKGVASKVFVSNHGRVFNEKLMKIITLGDNGNGYKLFSPCMPIKGPRYLHRDVAMAFIDGDISLQVNHIDGNKENNHVSNLEWVTPSRNIRHAHEIGSMKKRTENGEINILTVEQVVSLYTDVKKHGKQITKTATLMGIPRTTSSSIINKRSRSDITDKLDLEFASELS